MANSPYKLKKLRIAEYIQMQYEEAGDIKCQCKICKTYIQNMGYVDWLQQTNWSISI